MFCDHYILDDVVDTCYLTSDLVHGCLLLVLLLNADPTIPLQVLIHVVDVKVDTGHLF